MPELWKSIALKTGLSFPGTGQPSISVPVTQSLSTQGTVIISGGEISGLTPDDKGKYILIKDTYYLITADGVEGTPPDGTYSTWWGEDYGQILNNRISEGEIVIDLPAGNLLIKTQIEAVSGLTLIGHNTNFVKTTHTLDPTVEPNAAQIKETAFIIGDDLNDVNLYDITYTNIGYEDGEVTDVKYYTELNGVTVTYNRKKNKRVNVGQLFYGTSCTNVTIIGCVSNDCGVCLASGGSGWDIRENRANGWGEVAIYPPAASRVEYNTLLQDAPELSQDDINSDKGTSHGIYVTSAFDDVVIANNLIDGARVNGIQFNTLVVSNWDNERITDNTFRNCFRGFFVGGSGSHPGGDFTLIGNTFRDCGTLIELNCPSIDVYVMNCIFDGNGYERASMALNSFNSILFGSCTFRRRDSFTNDSGIRIVPDTLVGNITITNNCTFEDSNNWSIRIENPAGVYSGTLLIDSNTFESRLELGDTSGVDDKGFASQCTISNNVWDSDQVTSININMGGAITGNSFDIGGPVVVNNITNDEAVFDGNTWTGSGTGITAANGNGNYSMLNNTSTGPSWVKGDNLPNRDENNTGF